MGPLPEDPPVGHGRGPAPTTAGERLAWAFLLAGAILAPYQGTFRDSRRPAVVEFTLTASRPGMVELYLDSGRGFNEIEVTRQAFETGEHRVRLPIPHGSFHQIRLDPTNVRDTVSIADFVIVDTDSGARREFDVSLFKPAHAIADERLEHGRLVATTTSEDPSFILTAAEPIRVGRGGVAGAWLTMAALLLTLTATLLAGWRMAVAATTGCSPPVRVAVCLGLAVGLLIAPRLPWIDAPLLDWFSFRQTQTALTAHWFAVEGVSLPAYPLPLFGRPWTVPFEFPAYQLVAAAVHGLGVPLDPACRAVGLATFVACFGVLAWVLRRHGCPDFVLAVLWVFALASPFALVWSKAAMIEFTACLCGLVYVGLACEMHARGCRPALIAAILAAGAAAATIKITSFAVFLPACGMLAANDLWRRRTTGPGRLAGVAALWACAVAVPMLAGKSWVDATDAIKEASPATQWLCSANLTTWNHGTLAQRLDPGEWREIGGRINEDVLPWLWPFAVYGVVVLARLPTTVALAGLGMLVGAAGAVATFFSLYVVHDYYLCAVAFPLWLAAAAGLHGCAARLHAGGPWRRLLLPVVLAILVIATFRSEQVAGSCADFSDHEVLRFTSEVRRVVPPEDEVVIVGDGWNSRLPYYCRRKALMVRPAMGDAPFITDYVSRNDPRYVIVAGSGTELADRLFPDAEEVVRTETFRLRRRLAPRGHDAAR